MALNVRPRAVTFYDQGSVGGLGRNDAMTYTPGQVGAGVSTGAHAGVGVPDPRRASYPSTSGGASGERYLPRDARSYRGRGWGSLSTVVAGGPGSIATPDGSTTDQGLATLPAHTGETTSPHAPGGHVSPAAPWSGVVASPDPRRQFGIPGVDPAGMPYTIDPTIYPAASYERNLQIVVAGGPPIDLVPFDVSTMQISAGKTGRDNFRTARRWTATFNRPYGHWLAQHDANKHAMPDPLANTPLSYGQDIPNAIPSPGGRFAAAGMQGIGRDPQTARMVPQPWDAGTVTADGGQASAAVGTSRRLRGWR